MQCRYVAAALCGVLVAGAAGAQTPPPAGPPPAPQRAISGPPAPPPCPPPVVGQPVECRPPGSPGQTPAWPTQTRAPYTPSGVKFTVQTVAEGLESPWGLAFLPHGRMLVTERKGRMRIVAKNGKLSEPLAGVPEIHFQQISGLQDVVLDPNFRANHLIYFTFVEPRPGPKSNSGSTVARAKLVTGAHPRLEDVTVIYRQKPDLVTLHGNYGGRMLFDKSGYLIVTLGDRDGDAPNRHYVHEFDNGIGKFIRITTDGAPAPGNPFAGKPGALPELWALGFRNPLGVTFRPGTDEVWSVDVGPRGGDELNLVRAGGDYGWPVIGYGKEYTGQRVGEGTAKDGMEQPVYYWDPVISPSSVAFYDGDKFPTWKGNAFVTSLSQQHLARLVLDGDKVVGEERLLTDLHERMREVKQGPDGDLYLLTDNPKGRILRLVPAK